MISVFTFPNRILFGEAARRSIGEELRRWGGGRPLIVTDPGVRAAGLVDSAWEGLPDAPTFDRVQANPAEPDVLDGLGAYRSGGCDSLVAIGGGSAIDAAKAIRLLATHPGSLTDYDFNSGGTEKIGADLPPMIAVPTTAGTGSEAGRGALIQVPASGRKVFVLSPHLLPSTAICDPELTYGLSPALTAGTGMDAFTHAIESFLSRTFNPMCDGIALEALRWIGKGLESSVADGSNRESRRCLMLGALLAGVSFHKGLGVVHSLAHALGGVGRAHHGTLNAILLPHALRFNAKGAPERVTELAHRMGFSRGADSTSHLLVLVDLLLMQLRMPRRLEDLGAFDREQIPHYADLAMLDHCHRTNPCPCTREDMIALLEAAW